jgi:hypothetical protein
MIKFSNDTDILKYEPVLFGELHLPWQVLCDGSDGVLSGTTFTADGADFIASKVSPGGVVYFRDSELIIDGAYEIVSVDSATQLTVSVLRSDSHEQAVEPPQADELYYRISTFEPQTCEAMYSLTEYFDVRPGSPASDIEAEDILDKEVLRRASAFAVIAAAYAMLAGRNDDDGFWKKSHYYHKRFEEARSSARLSIDTGTDGVVDRTSSGGAVRLTRD